jgi:hypothetical protein
MANRGMTEQELTRRLTMVDECNFGSRDTESKELIRKELRRGIRIQPGQVVCIWRISEVRNNWPWETFTIRIERGNPKAGLKHMLKDNTQRPFVNKGINEKLFLELIEAATKFGHFIKFQSETHRTPRLIVALFFYGQPIAVAITIGENGCIVGANFSSWVRLKKEVMMTDEELEVVARWP